MKPKSQADQSQFQLFQSHFNQILNPDHPLVLFANKINWQRFDDALADRYCSDNGAAALPTRLLVGLHYLKHAFNESDDSLLERWLENPYWQYFCGFTCMQHKLPLHSTSLTKWRNRVGEEKMIELLQETISIAVREKQVSPLQLTQVNVDTTVQEKNIMHPTDSKLYYRAIVKLARAAKNRGIKLRQTYLRVGKKLAIQAARYAHAKHV
jgi:IS5 family transposase